MIFLKTNVKVIFHIDLNQFFCSVATIINPRLKGKAFAIGRENSLKGVISTASYEAREHGIHSGMPQIEAINKYPKLIIVSYDYSIYQKYSKMFFDLLHEYVSEIEQTSIDEGYLDVTNITLKINRHPYDLAKEIQTRALKELNLPCSIGIAPTLFLAKMASDIKKPLGITILRIRDIKTILFPLSVKEIYGIGKKTYPILIENGINTIKDFVDENNATIVKNIVGNSYNHFIECLNGKSNNVVDSNRYLEPESISKSTTFDTPLTSMKEVLDEILYMSDEIHKELIKSHKKTKTIGIILRNKAFKTITRSKTLEKPTNDKTIINYYLEDLVDENYQNEPLRLVGASYSNLVDSIANEDEEVTLFNYDNIYQKEEALQKLILEFEKRFGEKSIYFGKKIIK